MKDGREGGRRERGLGKRPHYKLKDDHMSHCGSLHHAEEEQERAPDYLRRGHPRERGYLRRRGRRRGGHRGLRHHHRPAQPGCRRGAQVPAGHSPGGEATLRRPAPQPPEHVVVELDEVDVHEFIKQRLVEADMDTSVPPYDSLQTYAYEGQGSPTGSISPLDSPGTQSEQDYNYLDDWGPEFQKLAELYGEADSDVTT
ncbi:hypothetical protein L3Q82_004684 [Scortum barcoo]|uniref:Uncharacterized protein n=1 Tax=Scortum barcoo TaxID=214431 RepID=A0ACB8VH31_9TELE|nr:hypothetical protein L3Q82_004684 [Scortum barcoo]